MFFNKKEPSTSLWELWNSDVGGPTCAPRRPQQYYIIVAPA
jgi:hypothetical protein